MQIDPDAVEKLHVNWNDFMYALENDIKPVPLPLRVLLVHMITALVDVRTRMCQAFGNAENVLERYLGHGVIVWSDVVHELLNDGDTLIAQAQSPESRGLVSVLFEGMALLDRVLVQQPRRYTNGRVDRSA